MAVKRQLGVGGCGISLNTGSVWNVSQRYPWGGEAVVQDEVVVMWAALVALPLSVVTHVHSRESLSFNNLLLWTLFEYILMPSIGHMTVRINGTISVTFKLRTRKECCSVLRKNTRDKSRYFNPAKDIAHEWRVQWEGDWKEVHYKYLHRISWIFLRCELK